MSVSRVHHCISQEMVAQGLEEPPAKKCSCRKFIPYRKADEMVKKGEARWTVTARKRGTQENVCPLCSGSEDVKNCAQCNGTGKVLAAAVWDTYKLDIVLVSQASVDKKEKKYRPALALKTPRVATIEWQHIRRAYVDGVKEAAERIEEYGRMNKEMIASLIVGYEPEDNPKTGEGRKYDHGRAI